MIEVHEEEEFEAVRLPRREGEGELTVGGLQAAMEELADEIAARPNQGEREAPLEELARMSELGCMEAPLPRRLGGLGLGTEEGGHLALLRLLATVGGADLVLGRLYEGHVNGLILIAAYGSEEQLQRAAEDVREGRLFGVWNTGEREPLRLESKAGRYTFVGTKAFCSGADFVQRPIVTAELKDRGWQMTVPAMDAPETRRRLQTDRQFWHPLGMEGSESYRIDFSRAEVTDDELIGQPGDFYLDPLFRGGAVRFAAVHAGGVLRLQRMFAEWLVRMRRAEDPYQVARLGEVSLRAQEVVLWVERAATVAEEGLHKDADKLARERMVECANMTRLAVERAATATMQMVVSGVGAHGLLQPSGFERMVRDLTMYLRQPAPDHTLAEVGRAAVRKSNLRADGAGNGMWQETSREGSLPPSYFHKIYERTLDPWDFEKSRYEAEKYDATLASLPRERYTCGFEVGCSIGVLTERLAGRCESLLSVDVSERALERARERCAGLPQVRFQRMKLPAEMPEARFDLIVVSEVAYYWTRSDVEAAIEGLAARHLQGGHLVLVHFTDPVPDYPLTGDQVHELWLASPHWKRVVERRAEHYRLDVLERV